MFNATGIGAPMGRLEKSECISTGEKTVVADTKDKATSIHR